MRIAQVAPLAEAVPPKLYGGTERVVSWLTEELVAQGHQVSLFASGDSVTSAELVPCSSQGLRLAGIRDFIASHIVMLDRVHRRAGEFDVIHFHVDLLQFAAFQDLSHKCVTTLHGRLDLPDFMPVFEAFPHMPLVSISMSQRAPLPPDVNWLANVHHGLGPGLCPYDPKGGDYLAFLRRIDFGVTSTSSSSWIQASERSSVMRIGGVRRTASSFAVVRMLVSFLPLSTLTSRSFSRVCSPTIMP